jgi:hypothetical protein
MNLASLSGARGLYVAGGHHRHPHAVLSRRRLLQAAGTAATGIAFGTALWRPLGVRAGAGPVPQPIPGGSPGIAEAFGTIYHVYAPGAPGFASADAEPATITEFSGTSGLAYVSGMVTRTNTRTGEVRELPFTDSDMRFMRGVYRGADGVQREGAFGFI